MIQIPDLIMELLNGEEITLLESTMNQHFITLCEDSAAFKGIWDKLTPENLSEVKIKQNGNILQIISGMTLTGTQTAINNDGTLTCHFYFTGGLVVEGDYALAGRILLGEGD